MPTYHDSNGRSYQTGKKIGSGGEGDIWEVVGDSTIVLKVYSQSVDSTKRRKLDAQISVETANLSRFAAWPLHTVSLAKDGWPVGFAMAAFPDRQEIHNLTSPQSRKQYFLDADWRFLLHVSANVARAVAAIHDAGQVIGDINERNFVVGRDGTVAILDCDSFEVRDNGVVFHCGVGTPSFLPPELAGKSLVGLDRTPNHDRFGLAVTIFQLLFLGRHPFGGRRLDGAESAIDANIRERLYAFGRYTSSRIAPPAMSPPLEICASEVVDAFERAFIAGPTEERPSAHEWVRILEAMSKNTRRCTENDSHWFRSSLANCPWCQLERTTPGLVIFQPKRTSGPSPSAPPQTFDVEALRRTQREASEILAAVEAVITPSPPPVSGRVQEALTRRKRDDTIAVWGVVILGIALVASPATPVWTGAGLAMAIGLAWLCMRRGERRILGLREESEAQLMALSGRRTATIDAGHTDTVKRGRERLAKLTESLGRLDANEKMRASDIAAASRSAAREAMDQHLRGFRIEHAVIPNIGPARVETLRKYGVVTAYDIERPRILRIPGFGESLANELINWKRDMERRLQGGQVNLALDTAVRRIEQRSSTEKLQLLNLATAAGSALTAVIPDLRREQQGLLKRDHAELSRRIAQLEVDLAALA